MFIHTKRKVSFRAFLLITAAVILYPFADLYAQESVGAKNPGIQFRRGEVSYIMANPKTELQKKITRRLQDYMSGVLKRPAKVITSLSEVPAKYPAIVLSSDFPKTLSKAAGRSASPEAFTIDSRTATGRKVVVAGGNTELGLKRAVQRLIMLSEQKEPGLVIGELHISESPWIPKREWTLANWTPQFPRGVFHNPHSDMRPNLYLYTDQQLATYVDMFDSFGFNGGQFATSTHGYQVSGTPEAFRDRQMKIAKALRANGQNVTYRIWASQFTGFGWADSTVIYKPAPGNTAFNDPKVRATFEKQYDFFAEMAPYVDMIIAQYFDPGQLKDRADVYNYMHLLINKFRAKKPDIDLGVMFWSVDGFKKGSEAAFMQELVDNNFSDAVLLENTMPHTYGPGEREALHEQAKRRNLKMGVWGWHTMERETDQTPRMHVNANVISQFYRQMRDGVDKIHPISYWSEMEAYHLANIFTAYAAGQLLWNPDRDPDAILTEISNGIWGSKNGPIILNALKLIQDTRSGPNWDTYWKGRPGHYFGTEDPKDDAQRAEKIILDLQVLTTDPQYVPKIPLPFPPATFVELMIPHIRQIKAFAEFRVKEKLIREAAKNGTSKDELMRLASEAWQPVPEYNTWIGTFGQPEFRMQEVMMNRLAKDLDIEINAPLWTIYRDADRYLQKIQTLQKRSSTPVTFTPGDTIGRSEFYWPAEKVEKYLQLLLGTGSMKKLKDGTYQLTNWEHYRLQ